MTDTTRRLMLLLVAAMLPAKLIAQDELLDEVQPPIKRYTVEIVVFQYVEDVSVGTEVFPGELIEPPTGEIEEIVVAERLRRHPDAIGLEPILLTEEEFTMHHVVEQFELLDAYATLLHVGWTQAGFPREDTDAMPLSTFGELPPGLDGSFTLYLGRYLHLVVDLTLDAPVEVKEFFVDDESVYSYLEEPPGEGPVRYLIQENRIIKNAEVRYFDHPKFGVVAKVTRIEELEEDPEDEPDGGALLSRVAQ